MKQTELYLKTIFCCMACDGEIAKEEVEMIKHLSSEYNIFSNIEIGLYRHCPKFCVNGNRIQL